MKYKLIIDKDADEPHLLYTWAKSTNNDECAVAVYSVDKCITPDEKQNIYIANGAEGDRVLAELKTEYSAKIFNCMGEEIFSNVAVNKGVNELNIPIGGLAVLTNK